MKTYRATVIFFVTTFCITLGIAFSLFPITDEPRKKQEGDREARVQEIVIPAPPKINDLYLIVSKEEGEVEKIYISKEGAKKYLSENNNTDLFRIEALSNMLWPNNKDVSFIKNNK